jgi:hypothetical protein
MRASVGRSKQDIAILRPGDRQSPAVGPIGERHLKDTGGIL